MPEISRFYGIVITFNYDEHLPPHFHARYGEYRAIIAVDGSVLAGALPLRALGLIRSWTALHREDLIEDWELARARSTAPLDRASRLESLANA